MKTTLAIIIIALASCAAFTSPKDPVTGIRQDAPESWKGTPNPLDTPAMAWKPLQSEGNFGHEWMIR